jgi:hypothetical protein
METATIYIGHDNTLDLVLVSTAASGTITYVDADVFTRYVVDLGDLSIDSEIEGLGPDEVFDTTDVVIGEDTVTALRMKLGLAEGVEAGSFKARLIGYNTDNPEGLVWQDKMPLKFLA